MITLRKVGSFCNFLQSGFMWNSCQAIVQFLKIKACVCYFLRNFYSSPNDSPSKTMKDVFYFIEKAVFVLEIFKYLYCHLPLFLSVSHCLRAWFKINRKVYDVINCLNKNLTHFVWYLEKEKRYDVETLTIHTLLNEGHFYGKIMMKMCTKS